MAGSDRTPTPLDGLRRLAIATLVAVASAASAALMIEGADERPFLAENEAAMSRMMTDMEVAPTGDVDRDFLSMMIPHHQGAVDMARAVLRHGADERVRRLAQGIVVEQEQEIALMRLLMQQAPAPQPGAAAPAKSPAQHVHHAHSN